MNVMKFNCNLSLAQQAIIHVKSICRLGSGNRYEDIEKSRGENNRIIKMYTENAIREAKRAYRPQYGSMHRFFATLLAKKAKLYGCGNCMEQSHLAFEFLCQKVSLVDVFSIKSLRIKASNLADGDHVFTVIGLTIRKEAKLLPIYEMSLWNPEAIVCDPWNHDAYPAFMYSVKSVMGGGWHLIERDYGND